MTTLRSGHLVVALVLALAFAVPASANLLTNPGFETDAVAGAAPVPGATGWGTGGTAETASDPMDPVRTGIGSLKLSSTFPFEVSTAEQAFPASPGQEYNMNGWMLTPDPLPANTTFGLLKIVFRDAAGMDLEPASVSIGQFGPAANPGVESLPFLNAASTPGVWNFTEAQGVAPAGTTEVLFLALNVGESLSMMYFDDLEATLIPEPGSLTLIGFGALLLAGLRRRQR